MRRIPSEDAREESSGPFAAAAPELHGARLFPVPLGGDSGQVPLVRFATLKRHPSQRTLEKWARQHRQSNVGILTGLSRLTVVDIDDPKLVADMIARFGETPLHVHTPRGGVHLYYRSSGERSTDLRSEGLAVDIKGLGGMVVAPPSVRPRGEHAGKLYAFNRGDWSDVPDLPTLRSGSLDLRETAGNVARLRSVGVGKRNWTLFKLLLREARHCDDLDPLLDVAETVVADHFEQYPHHPFTAAEALRVARSAWRYETEGQNWVGREARAVLPISEIDALADCPDAFLLLAKLRVSHGARDGPFAIAPKAMHFSSVFPGWSPRRYMKARDILVARGFVTRAHWGGRGKNDPALFVFPDVGIR